MQNPRKIKSLMNRALLYLLFQYSSTVPCGIWFKLSELDRDIILYGLIVSIDYMLVLRRQMKKECFPGISESKDSVIDSLR